MPSKRSKCSHSSELELKVANDIRVAGLCFTLDDIASSLSGLQTTDKQANDLSTLVTGCRGVLEDAERYIRKNESLGIESPTVSSKTRKAWRKLKWDPATVNELRDRMVATATYLNTFNASLARYVLIAKLFDFEIVDVEYESQLTPTQSSITSH